MLSLRSGERSPFFGEFERDLDLERDLCSDGERSLWKIIQMLVQKNSMFSKKTYLERESLRDLERERESRFE